MVCSLLLWFSLQVDGRMDIVFDDRGPGLQKNEAVTLYFDIKLPASPSPILWSFHWLI